MAYTSFLEGSATVKNFYQPTVLEMGGMRVVLKNIKSRDDQKKYNKVIIFFFHSELEYMFNV